MKFIQFILIVFMLSFALESLAAHEIYVSNQGSDQNSGTQVAPYATFERALVELRKYAGKEAVTVWFHEGTFYLGETILLDAKLSGSAENPITFSSFPGAKVTIKGSKLLTELQWKTYKNGIYVTSFPANFLKTKEVIYPSWYSTLIAGKYEGEKTAKTKALELEVEGALLINIAEDPDLIDATGGYDYGCYFKSIDAKKGRMWLNARLDKDWVIQKVNGKRVQNIADLQKYLKEFKGKNVIVIATRDYKEKKFKVNFKKI